MPSSLGLCLLLGILLAVVSVPSEARENVARLPGVIAVVDTESRDRWGIDGYHAANLCDGVLPTVQEQVWASDNWEVTHTAALILPRRARVEAVTLHWWKQLTPRHARLQGWRNGKWQLLAMLHTTEDSAISRLTFAPVEVEAIRLVQPPDGAHPKADRRLWIGEMEVFGSATTTAVPAAALAEQVRSELHQLRHREDAARVAPQIALATKRRKPHGFLGSIKAEDVRRGRENVAKRPWARALSESILKDADWWVEQPDTYLRALIPVGNPRALCPQFEKGCPIHGGARMSFDTTLETPYRWRCKQGGEWWYDGMKVNNPTTGEEVTVHDDGSGWLAPPGFPNAGRRYFFVAAYRYYLLGKLFSSPYEPDSGASRYEGGTPIVQLALAYAISGDARYAHKAAVLLSRLADLYKTYDGGVEGPSQRQDGYIGNTFERFLVQNLILACDLIWDALDRPQQDHLQHDLLAYIYEYLHRLMPYFDGDFLMYEMTALAALASTLDNPDITAEVLSSDTGLGVLMNNSWFRDGKFIYDSTGYNVGNARTPPLTAEWLQGFVAPPRYPKPLDVFNAPEYHIPALFDFVRNIDCDGRLPQIGDGGGARSKTLRLTPAYDPLDERALAYLPTERAFYTARLQAAAGGDLESYRRGNADWWLLFHADKPLPAVSPSPQAPAPTSHLFPDSGIAILRAGASAQSRQHIALTFSKGRYGHGHRDKLAINVIRYGYDLSADLGYPTTWTDIKYGGWETNAASHCTVMLDERDQHGNAIGQLDFYAALPMVDVVEASAEKAAYPDASLYRRTVAQVRDDNGEPLYTFDVFRVAGAEIRDYLFHSLGKPEDLTVALDDRTAQWTAQPQGSLAGENVAPMSTENGYSFLFDLQRARSDGNALATWRSSRGVEQGDNYLLTRQTYHDFVAEFTMTRTGRASGTKERAFFVFGADAANPQNRRVFGLDDGTRLSVGKPVRVRIEVRGGQATLTMEGKVVSTTPESVGEHLEAGSVGFLHYYNYAYDYTDFVLTPQGGASAFHADFARPLDPAVWNIGMTYTVSGGLLHASDSESVGLALRILGAPGREIIRAKAEGYGLRGQSPLEGHFIVRDRQTDRAAGSAFVAVIEAFQEQTRVTAIDSMPITPAADTAPDGKTHLNAVAVRIKAGDRTDYLLSALEAKPRVAELDGMRIEFNGRFGLVTTRNGKITSLSCVGGSLACGGQHVASPPTAQGSIVATDVEHNIITVRLTEPGRQPLPGERLLIRNERFVTPAVYQVVKAEKMDATTWRVQVDMPFLLARGVVGSVDAAQGTFASRTPVMKLRVNPGLFDGKRVRARLANDAPETLLTSTEEKAFVLAGGQGLDAFPVGGSYVILDIGTGDNVEIIGAAQQSP